MLIRFHVDCLKTLEDLHIIAAALHGLKSGYLPESTQNIKREVANFPWLGLHELALKKEIGKFHTIQQKYPPQSIFGQWNFGLKNTPLSAAESFTQGVKQCMHSKTAQI